MTKTIHGMAAADVPLYKIASRGYPRPLTAHSPLTDTLWQVVRQPNGSDCCTKPNQTKAIGREK